MKKNDRSDVLGTFIKEIINESKKLVGMTDVMPFLNQFIGRPVIFFDTETMGLTPHGNQLLEVAVVVARLDDWTLPATIIDRFHMKATLNRHTKWRIESEDMMPDLGPPDSPVRKKYGLTQRELLRMTHYEEPTTDFVDERVLLEGLVDIVSRYPDGVLVAHNAPFDIKFINVRLQRMDMPKMPRLPVIDTLQLVRFYLSPILTKASGEELKALAAVAPKSKFGKVSMRLGDLAQLFKFSAENWHSAIADVEMMMAVIAAAIGVIQRNPIERGSAAGKEQEREWLSFMKRRRGSAPKKKP